MLAPPAVLGLRRPLADRNRRLRVGDVDGRPTERVPDRFLHLVEGLPLDQDALGVELDPIVHAVGRERRHLHHRLRHRQHQRARLHRLEQHRLRARRGDVEVDGDHQLDHVGQLRPHVVDDHFAADQAVGHQQLVLVGGDQARRAPADVEDAAAIFSKTNPLAGFERLLGMQGETGEEVAQRLLQRKAEHHREQRAGREQRRQVELVLDAQQHRRAEESDRPDAERAQDARHSHPAPPADEGKGERVAQPEHGDDAEEPRGGFNSVCDGGMELVLPEESGQPCHQVQKQQPLRRAQLVEELLDREVHPPRAQRSAQEAHEKEQGECGEKACQRLQLRHARIVACERHSEQEKPRGSQTSA